MNKLPNVDISYRPLHEISMGPLKAALLNHAIDLKIFDELTRPVTSEEIAKRLGTDAGNTQRFLNALATIDLLGKKNGRYQNLPIADTFLVSASPSCIAPLLKQTQDNRLNPLDQLPNLVKSGPLDMQEQVDLADESIWMKEAITSSGWVLGGAGQLVADMVANLPEFKHFENMLELGCGHGVFSLYILNEHPSLTSVLLDRPKVLDAAEFFCEKYGFRDRVRFFQADYITDSICDTAENRYDLIFASATLNFAIHKFDDLMQKIYHALTPGGYFISFQDGMTHEQTHPDTMLGAVIPAMMGGADYFFPQGMIAQSAAKCGFQSIRSRTVETPVGEMDIDIARKA